MSTNNPSPDENTYVMNPENAAEMARLSLQGRALTSIMGNLLPASIAQTTIQHVLDLACGPGEWVIAVAEAYPHLQVIGVDIDALMINYAQYLAADKKLSNAHFHRAGILQPLPFANESFNFINARLIFSFMRPADWKPLIQTGLDLLRPGGTLRLTETEVFLSNSPAAQRMQGLFTQALRQAGQSLSVDDHFIGLLPQLRRFLHEAGFVNIQTQPYMIDFSVGAEQHQDIMHDLIVAYKLVQPFMLKWQVAQQDELTRIYQEMVEEMTSDTFYGLWWYLSVWGEKPRG